MPIDSRVLHFPSMTHRMGISKSDMRGKCLLLYCTAAVTGGAVSSKYRLQWLWLNNEEKKWLGWLTKIDLALLCALSSPHPSLFSIFRAPPGWRKSRKATAERGRRDEKGRGGEEEGSKRGTTRTRKLLQPGEEQTGFKKQSTGHRVLEGVGLGQGTVRQTLG